MFSSSGARPYGFAQLGGGPGGRADRMSTEAIMAEARDQGHELGYQEGLKRALEDQRSATTRIARLVDQARLETGQFTREFERQIVELTLAVAQKVIEREVASDPSLVVDVVRAAINEIQDATSIHVRLHPEDHALLEDHWNILGRNALGEPIILLADDRVQRGGCLIETKLGHIDGQLSTRLAQVTSLFGALLDGEPT